MKSTRLLRIASVITLLYFAGHTADMPWTPAVGSGDVPVLEAMKSHSFDAEGFKRTYWDFYFGFDVIISGFLLVQAVALWQLGSLGENRRFAGSSNRRFLLPRLSGQRTLDAVPVVMAVAISVCLALAFVTAGRTKKA